MSSTKFKINDIHIRRKGKSGMSVKSETITMDMDPDKLGQPVVEAIAKVIQDQIRRISVSASPSTLARSLRGGRQNLTRRSDKLFNATGRLVERLGLKRTSEGEWDIGAPPGRLEGEQASLIDRLVELVPVLESPAKLFQDRRVRAAQEKSLADSMKKARLK